MCNYFPFLKEVVIIHVNMIYIYLLNMNAFLEWSMVIGDNCNRNGRRESSLVYSSVQISTYYYVWSNFICYVRKYYN